MSILKKMEIGKLGEVSSSKRIFAEEYVPKGVPFFRSKEIGELSRGENIQSELFISHERYSEIKEKFGIPQKGDLLLTSVGSIGNTWIVDNRKFYFKDGNITRIAPSKNLEIKYLQYYFKSNLFWNVLLANSSGTAYNALTISKLKKLKIPLPPLPIQKKIAAILDEADKLRRLNQQVLEKYDALTQAVFLEMFGDPFNGKTESLSKNIELIGGYAFKSSDFVEAGIPLIKIGTVNKGYFDTENFSFLPSSFEKKYSKWLIKEGDILMSLTGTVGKNDYGNVEIATNKYESYFLNQRVAKIFSKNGIYISGFLHRMFAHPKTKKELTKISRGVRQANISNKDILSLKMIVPPLEKQHHFVKAIKNIEAQKSQAQASLAKSEELFNALLQKAFKGELVK